MESQKSGKKDKELRAGQTVTATRPEPYTADGGRWGPHEAHTQGHTHRHTEGEGARPE